jgi:Domain of unknown function (DUF4160)
MSEISRFFGIIIAIHFNEHGIPHFHAKYGEFRGVFSIENLNLMEGFLPKRVISLVLEWAFQHRDELKTDWDLSQSSQLPKKIEPLE